MAGLVRGDHLDMQGRCAMHDIRAILGDLDIDRGIAFDGPDLDIWLGVLRHLGPPPG